MHLDRVSSLLVSLHHPGIMHRPPECPQPTVSQLHLLVRPHHFAHFSCRAPRTVPRVRRNTRLVPSAEDQYLQGQIGWAARGERRTDPHCYRSRTRLSLKGSGRTRPRISSNWRAQESHNANLLFLCKWRHSAEDLRKRKFPGLHVYKKTLPSPKPNWPK